MCPRERKRAFGPPTNEQNPPAPTPHRIVAGGIWSGKLPREIFLEHCEKQGWEIPRFEDVWNKKGSHCISCVHIGLKNHRSGELQEISFHPPARLAWVPQPTLLEAQNLCATYALHRVCSMRYTKHMLPPAHKEFWEHFEEIRLRDTQAGRAWMYEADPFAVVREHEAVKEIAQDWKKKRGERPASCPPSGRKMRGWMEFPVVDMAMERRQEAERLVRRLHVWNPHRIVLDDVQRNDIVSELVDLGFRRAHVLEACDRVGGAVEALEWLLVHLPEDDLPPQFLQEGHQPGIAGGTSAVATASAASLPAASAYLALEISAKRLAAAGYSLDLCRQTLAQNDSDEDCAAEALMHMLTHEKSDVQGDDAAATPMKGDAECEELWVEELGTVESVFAPDRLTYLSATSFQIDLKIQPRKKGRADPKDVPEKLILRVRKPTRRLPGAKPYPYAVPTLELLAKGERKLPAHVRLSAVKQAAAFARGLRGDYMLLVVVDWFETEILDIAADPGRLIGPGSALNAAAFGPRQEEIESPIATLRNKTRNMARHETAAGLHRPPIDWTLGTPESMRILQATQARLATPAQRRMVEARESLPAWSSKQEIVDAVNSAQVVMISGETGSGKSTQAVQFILDDLIQRRLGGAANIVCTQPHRISAIGLADRVSAERCQDTGQEVGYAIHGETKRTPGLTRIVFVTTGVLLRRIQSGDALNDVSHVVVDEVHERTLDTDLLLALLKNIIGRGADLKVVLMSATIDADVLADYFGGVRTVRVQGRTFPVSKFHLEHLIQVTGYAGDAECVVHRLDPMRGPQMFEILEAMGNRINYNLLGRAVAHIDRWLETDIGDLDGGILIFLPGVAEILRSIEAIGKLPGAACHYHVLPLHASLQAAEQRKVFLAAPRGLRKVVVATNVAETSITINDIVCVIDSGRVKEVFYDADADVVRLQEGLVSRAAAEQRCGRAGRVRNGYCFKMYTWIVEMHGMKPRAECEMRRVPLEQTCLSVKAMGVDDVRAFLATTPSPPANEAVERALMVLEHMGATADGKLTALGRHMAMIPADLRSAKLAVYGVLFGCVEPAVTVASILNERSPFVAAARLAEPWGRRDPSEDERRRSAGGQGDLLADCRAWERWDVWRQQRSSAAATAAAAAATAARRAAMWEPTGEPAGVTMGGATEWGELREWCRAHHLIPAVLHDIAVERKRLLEALGGLGFLAWRAPAPLPAWLRRNNDNGVLLRGLIAGALAPRIARIERPEQRYRPLHSGALAVDPPAQQIRYTTNENGAVTIHPSSTLAGSRRFANNADFLAFFTKMVQSHGVSVSECTPTNPYSILFFGGKMEVDPQGRGITLDGWIRLRVWGRIGVLVKRLRELLDDAVDGILDGGGGSSNAEVLACIEKLIENNGR